MTFFAVFALLIDIVAIYHVFSVRGTVASRSAWIAAIILLPLVGAAAWLLTGPRQRRHSTSW
ncbi:MAG: PLDc N-terminal domain-containing protein [Pseudomonadota bacterium]